jgi:hypothetical protein
MNDVKTRFFADPQWVLVEQMIQDYLDPLQFVDTIPDDLTNDQLAAEVRGRKLTIKQLNKFLVDSGIVKGRALKEQFNYK